MHFLNSYLDEDRVIKFEDTNVLRIGEAINFYTKQLSWCFPFYGPKMFALASIDLSYAKKGKENAILFSD